MMFPFFIFMYVLIGYGMIQLRSGDCDFILDKFRDVK